MTESTSTHRNPETVYETINERAQALKRRELERAIGELESAGKVTPSQRAIIDEMATDIVDGLLAGPRSVLHRSQGHDQEVIETAIEVFDPKER